MALTLVERCQKRLEGLQANRKPWEAEAKEIASLAQPARSRWLSSDTNKAARQRNARLNSSHGIFAFRTLQGGMTSGLSSPSRPWFTYTLDDEGLKEDPEVKAWLAEVERIMYAVLAGIDFYEAAKTGYLELGLFGTEACFIEDSSKVGIVCHPLTFGEYWIGLGANRRPDTLYRRCPMTVIQAYQRFGSTPEGRARLSSAITSAYDASRYDEVCEFYHAIEPNTDLEPGYADYRGRAFRSVYWDCKDNRSDKGPVEISGMEEQPFWASRWDTTGSDAWGNGPGHDALPDLRELQVQVKRKGEATDHHIKPEKVSDSKVRLKGMPGNVVSVSAADVTKLVYVPYQVPYQSIAALREDVSDCKEAVNLATYADLFMAITNMQGIQPRNIEEIAARNEEKLTQLGPVIERSNIEKLQVGLDRFFGILQRGRILPPPPESLDGKDVRPDFISILTQMQRMVGLGQIERTAGFVGGLVATFPDAGDNLDYDEAVREYADRAGAPPKMIRTAKDVEQIRAKRAQQQNMEAMVNAAPAAKDGATAAKVLSEIDQGSLPIAGAMPL